MVGGMYLLSRMDVNSANRDVTMSMVVLGIGLGTAIPLYMLAVQNAVPYRLMGIATSTQQFLRSVGGTMGVAVMFSLIQANYHDGLARSVPQEVQQDPRLSGAIRDPQFLLDTGAESRLEQAFSGFGPQGVQLFDATIQGVRDSLAVAIGDTFMISTFVVMGCVAVSLFMKEIPLRKVHFVVEEGLAPPPPEDAAGVPSPAAVLGPSDVPASDVEDGATPIAEVPASAPTWSRALNDSG
jgi:hypothetical protein